MSACAICEHADRTGSWVDAPGFEGMTHCRRCHRSWPRASELQHCTACCRTFTNARAADFHRGPRGCLDPASVTDSNGNSRLALSTRTRDARATVEVWAQAARPGHAWPRS